MKLSWPTKKLGEVCSLDRGTNPIHSSLFSKIKKSNYIRFVQLRDFETDNYVVYIPKNLKITISNKDDSIVALSGATAGKVVMGVEGAINSALLRIRPLDSNILNKSFLHYFLLFSQKSLSRLGRGGAQPNISKRDVAKIKIPIPPLSIQRKIVERLDAIKRAQELNDKQIALADELFQSLLRQELDPKGKNWGEKKLGEICEKITDGTHKTPRYIEKGIPFLSVKNVREDSIDFKDIKYISIEEHKELIKRCRPRKNDILYTKVGTVGIAKTIEKDKEFSIFVSVALLQPKLNLIIPKFLEFVLNSHIGRNQAHFYVKGIGVPDLHLVEIKKFKIPLPPIKTQQKIVEKLSAVQEYKKKLLEQEALLKELFESVLNKSMKGELIK